MNQKETITFNPDEIPCQEISDPAVLAKTPLVSVGMITYNHEPYIDQAIEGVLMQETDFPIELVIGEDCSTDRTREIVLEYQEKHPDLIRVITSDKNVGAHKNSWRTENSCRGKYIAFCEGDDYWHHSRKLQMQVDYLESHPECGLVHGGADMFHVETGRRMPWRPHPSDYDTKGNIFLRLLGHEYAVLTLTACVRSELLRSLIEANPDVFNGQYLMGDAQRWLELSRVSEVKRFNDSLATHNTLPESAGQSKDIRKRIRFKQSVYALRMHYVKKYDCPRETELRIRRKYNRLFLLLAFDAVDRELAVSARRELAEIGDTLTLMQRLLFLGATSKSAHFVIGSILNPARRIRKRFQAAGFSRKEGLNN